MLALLEHTLPHPPPAPELHLPPFLISPHPSPSSSSIPTPSTSSPPRPRASVSPCLPLGKSVMSTSTTPLWATRGSSPTIVGRISRFSILTARVPPIQFGLLACTALNGAHLGFGHLCCQCRVYTPRLWSYKVACAVCVLASGVVVHANP